MEKRSKFDVFWWSGLLFVVSLALTFYIANIQKKYLEANQITLPQVSPEVPLAYFFGVVILFGIILFFIPVSKLKIALRAMFAFLYAWGMFIAFVLILPFPAAVIIALAAGSVWFFIPLVWLHNLLMIITLAAVGSVFGFILSPWTALLLMVALSIYDFLAVRFGYMLWMARKFSESDTLPAFVIPKKGSEWNLNLRAAGFKQLLEDKPQAERGFSILGGGDIGFPLLLSVAVFLSYGISKALIVAAFSLVGLIGAYCIHLFLVKGKPVPALPPITCASIIGFLIVHYLI